MANATSSMHNFWHQEDDYTITSQGVVWVYPNKTVPTNTQRPAIWVLPERREDLVNPKVRVAILANAIEEQLYYGICSDYLGEADDYISEKYEFEREK